MPLESGFYNSLNGDRRYYGSQFSSMFDGLINDGVYASIGDTFAVTPSEGLQVLVGTGKAWFKEVWVRNRVKEPIDFDIPDPIFDRIDTVVITVNKTDTVRASDFQVIKGEIGVTPVPPALPEEDAVFHLPLANVHLNANATEITAADIDILVGSSVCPFVTSIIQQTNIDMLFANWNEQFMTWWNGLKNILDGDVVGNILNALSDKVSISDKATMEEAVAGTSDDKWMTPAKTLKTVWKPGMVITSYLDVSSDVIQPLNKLVVGREVLGDLANMAGTEDIGTGMSNTYVSFGYPMYRNTNTYTMNTIVSEDNDSILCLTSAGEFMKIDKEMINFPKFPYGKLNSTKTNAVIYGYPVRDPDRNDIYYVIGYTSHYPVVASKYILYKNETPIYDATDETEFALSPKFILNGRLCYLTITDENITLRYIDEPLPLSPGEKTFQAVSIQNPIATYEPPSSLASGTWIVNSRLYNVYSDAGSADQWFGKSLAHDENGNYYFGFCATCYPSWMETSSTIKNATLDTGAMSKSYFIFGILKVGTNFTMTVLARHTGNAYTDYYGPNYANHYVPAFGSATITLSEIKVHNNIVSVFWSGVMPTVNKSSSTPDNTNVSNLIFWKLASNGSMSITGSFASVDSSNAAPEISGEANTYTRALPTIYSSIIANDTLYLMGRREVWKFSSGAYGTDYSFIEYVIDMSTASKASDIALAAAEIDSIKLSNVLNGITLDGQDVYNNDSNPKIMQYKKDRQTSKIYFLQSCKVNNPSKHGYIVMVYDPDQHTITPVYSSEAKEDGGSRVFSLIGNNNPYWWVKDGTDGIVYALSASAGVALDDAARCYLPKLDNGYIVVS